MFPGCRAHPVVFDCVTKAAGSMDDRDCPVLHGVELQAWECETGTDNRHGLSMTQQEGRAMLPPRGRRARQG